MQDQSWKARIHPPNGETMLGYRESRPNTILAMLDDSVHSRRLL